MGVVTNMNAEGGDSAPPRQSLVVMLAAVSLVMAVVGVGLGAAGVAMVSDLRTGPADPPPLATPPLPGVLQSADGRPKLILAQDIDWPPYAYLGTPPESEFGVAGLGHDVAMGLGDLCGWDVSVVQADWKECWVDDRVQQGLKFGHFHGCMTYTHTKGSRSRQMEFSGAFLQDNQPAGILTRLNADGTPHISPQSNLDGLKIADVNGWAPTADGLKLVKNQCTGENFSGFELVVPNEDGNDPAMRLLMNGDVDGVFVYANQAKNYQCTENTATPDWDCDLWAGFGTKYAYVQTGMFNYQTNGTTLAMAKKGSGVAEMINPCLQRFLQTKEYYDICVKHDVVASCYKNSYFPEGSVEVLLPELPTSKQTGDCSNGYCPCQ